MHDDSMIEIDLLSYLPEEREDVLFSQYGRYKEEFPWIDFGEEASDHNNSESYIDNDDEDKPDVCDTSLMTSDQIWELGNAGIELDDFDLMDNEERIEALEAAGLDPEDFE